jgi:hypothetical protein
LGQWIHSLCSSSFKAKLQSKEASLQNLQKINAKLLRQAGELTTEKKEMQRKIKDGHVAIIFCFFLTWPYLASFTGG